MLIFFAYLANKKTKLGYFYVVPSLINMLGFVTLLLLFLVNNNTDMSYSIFGGSYHNNLLTGFFKNVMLIGFLLFILLMKNYLDTFRNYDFEFIIMIFFSLFSSILLLNMNDLITLFFVIELQSLASYVLVASKQDSTSSTEAGLKYFILGCFSSGMVLFGISIIYGFTGLLSYHDLSLFLTTSVLFDFSTNYIISFSFVGLIIGISFLTAGLLFKFGAVPFHM
jgi:NADH:ubiquinone oxidoreductase subunit 2 (subunit N)